MLQKILDGIKTFRNFQESIYFDVYMSVWPKKVLEIMESSRLVFEYDSTIHCNWDLGQILTLLVSVVSVE